MKGVNRLLTSKTVFAKKDVKFISPRTDNQKKYMQLLQKDKPYIVVGSGPAGTGKTLLSVTAGVQSLIAGRVDRIVITRPAVSVDEQFGFLPGNLEAKMQPWVRPIHDVLKLNFPLSKVDHMIKEKIVDIVPLAFMRGLTFERSWIICDEAQNTTVNQMKMVLTRIGKDSKMVITGDPFQYDRGFDVNGFSDFLQRLENQPIVDENNESLIDVVHFGEHDVERHRVIKPILELYNDL